MTNRLAIAMCGAMALTAGAVDAQKGESLMFGDDVASLQPQERALDDAGARCEALRNEIDALKGRPQRRAAAMSRYEAECQGGHVATPFEPSRP